MSFASTSSASPVRRFPDMAATYVLVALALLALRSLLTPIAPHDFWWHLAQGRRIAAEGAVPQLDYFSYTRPGQPFFNQMWLGQWLLFQVYRVGGVPLLVFAQAALLVGVYGALLALAARRGGNAKIAAALLLIGVMPVSFDNWLLRPQSCALPCFALFLIILTAYRLQWPRWRYGIAALPFIEVFWANAHGSFLLGIILVMLTGFGEVVRTLRRAENALSWRKIGALALVGALCGAAIFCNPRGVGVLDYVRFVLNAPETRLSSEWLPPDYRTANGVWFAVYAVAFLAALWRGARHLTFTDFCVSLPFLAQAAREGRSVIWFAMASFPVFAAALRRDKSAEAGGQPLFNAALIGFVWLLPLGVLPWWKPALGLPPQVGALIDAETPVAAVRALQQLPAAQRPQQLWHDEATGSYLIWAAPEQKVFIDTRFEFYPLSQWNDARTLRFAEPPAEVLPIIARYRLDGFLLHRRNHAKLLRFLEKRGGYREQYRDEVWILLLPENP